MLALTRSGRELLKKDPLDDLARAVSDLSDRQLTSLTTIMEKLARATANAP